MHQSTPAKASGKPSGQSWFLALAVTFSGALVAYVLLFYGGNGVANPPANSPADKPSKASAATGLKLSDIPFDGERAYDYLKQICDIGPRISGTAGMQKQQKLLTDHFEKLGGKVELQKFRSRNPADGQPVSLANLIVEWHPDSRERILLCAHYDTRPLPDRDRLNPQGTFIGANDGASGVALLMELAQSMAKLEGRYGVDFVLLDGEEMVYDDNDPYFLGSEYFARQYVAHPPKHHYRWGVLLDMVADADLQVFQEVQSTKWRDVQPLVKDIWATAKRLGVKEFVPRPKHDLRDDHLALHNIGKIPICDIIDFDYPQWHTQADTPQHCSALSLAKVGWVVEEWLKSAVSKK